MSKKTSQSGKPEEPQPFHLRFDISVGVQDAHSRFLNRVDNLLFKNFIESDAHRKEQAYWRIANVLGEQYKSYNDFKYYAKGQFLRCLQCIEAAYESLNSPESKTRFEFSLSHIFSLSEIDLGVAWERGRFRRSGSALLDEALVNDPLGTLSDTRFASAREPLLKALTHLLEGERRPELFADVITDCYESLEACAKIVTGRKDNDLSANAEFLISQVPVSPNLKDALKAQLKAYIAYGNTYRHAKKPDDHRSLPTKTEAEAFVYETGLFIRLATSKA
jgi:hypothetical protein